MLKVLSALVLAFSLLAVSFVRKQSAPPTHATQPTASAPKYSKVNNPVPQELFCGLWRTDHTYEATIRIKNNLVTGPMEVTPVLFMADGSEYDLNPVTINSSEVTVISINDALSDAPSSVQSHLSQYGSASLRFKWGWSAVDASVRNLDVPRSLIHQYPFQMVMQTHSGAHNTSSEPHVSPASTTANPQSAQSNHQVMEGLWWKHDPGVEGFVAMSNTTADELDVHISISDSQGRSGPGKTFSVASHATALVNLADLRKAASVQADDRQGGVRISYDGEMGALVIAGGLENPSEGFSSQMVFRMVRQAKTDQSISTYASVGLMVGKPDPMMGFPGSTTFTPYTVLRNGDTKPLQIQSVLYYLDGMQTRELSVPNVTLMPWQTTSLDANALLAAAGMKNYSGTVHWQFSYQGNPGALMIVTTSVDQTGTYVFDVSAKAVQRDRGKRVPYWENQNGTDTMFTLWNPDSAPEDLVMTFYFHKGTYKYPIHLDGHATAMFNISELAMHQQPDVDGHVFPADAKIGSALITDAEDRAKQVEIIVAVGTFDIDTATCGIDLCDKCDDAVDMWATPDSFDLIRLSLVQQVTHTFEFNDGGQRTGEIIDMSSADSSIASVDGNDNSTSMGVGNTQLFGNATTTVEGAECYVSGECDEVPLNDNSSASVGPRIMKNGQDITGTTQTTAIGLTQNLTSSYTLPGGVTVNNQSWSIDGSRLQSWTASTDGGISSTPPTLNQQATSFFWYAAANPLNVTFTINLSDNTQATASTTFNVKAPASPNIATTFGQVVVNSGNVLQLGGENSTPSTGVLFTASATPPSGFDNTFQFVQVIDTDELIIHKTDNTEVDCLNESGLDNSYPYPSATDTTANDGPSVDMFSSTEHEDRRLFNAKMYLMWSPVSGSNIWVSLGYVAWGFTADAAWNSTNQRWEIQSGTEAGANSFTATSSYPDWNNVYKNGVGNCPNNTRTEKSLHTLREQSVNPANWSADPLFVSIRRSLRSRQMKSRGEK